MTLLAYDLPKARGFTKAPSWIDLLNAYAQPLIALMITFIIAGMFWFSHQRRLAIAPEGSRVVVFLNLIFLLSIIILPRYEWPLWSLPNRQCRRRHLRDSSEFHRNAERVAVASRTTRSQRNRVAGNRDFSCLRALYRHGCRLRRPTRRAIRMVLSFWRACRGLVGSPALALRPNSSSIPGEQLLSSLTRCSGRGPRLVAVRRPRQWLNAKAVRPLCPYIDASSYLERRGPSLGLSRTPAS